MKLKNLFETQEKDLIGQTISGTLIDETIASSRWNGDFVCANKKLTSLEGAPVEVTGRFNCSGNLLPSLEGAPTTVTGRFNCSDNKLFSLEGAPRFVGSAAGDYFDCSLNYLPSLNGAPKEINGDFICNSNDLTSLRNIHKHIKKIHGMFSVLGNPIESHVLGLILIDGITRVMLDHKGVQQILNDGIKNKKHWTEVQAELEEAGFEEYAQL